MTYLYPFFHYEQILPGLYTNHLENPSQIPIFECVMSAIWKDYIIQDSITQRFFFSPTKMTWHNKNLETSDLDLQTGSTILLIIGVTSE